MTSNTLIPTIFKDFDQFFVGTDTFLNTFGRQLEEHKRVNTNYPPYNISKIGDFKYSVEISASGFSKSDIEIKVEDQTLTVIGQSKKDVQTDQEYLYKGIAGRSFTRTFTLAEYMEVKNASMKDGILTISIEQILPDHKKPRTIEIKDEVSEVTEKQFLTEESKR
jgi:molecular chaperone IbpA